MVYRPTAPAGPTSEAHAAPLALSLPHNGRWYAWARLYYPGASAEGEGARTLFLGVEGGPYEVIGGGDREQWLWAGHEGKPISLGCLAAGEHTLVVLPRAANGQVSADVAPRLDLLLLTDDATYVPRDVDYR